MTQGPQKYADPSFKAAVVESMCEQLAEGNSIVQICLADNMPSLSTVMSWQADDADFAGKIRRARETGYLIRGERAVQDAKTAPDAGLGRLAFDAERWYLGKLSNAFRDKSSVELTGKDGGAIQVDQVQNDADAFARRIASIAARINPPSGDGET